MVVIEDASVLGDHIQLASERREGATVERVAMGSAKHAWARLVDSRMKVNGGNVDHSFVKMPRFLHNVPLEIDENEIRGLYEREVQAL